MIAQFEYEGSTLDLPLIQDFDIEVEYDDVEFTNIKGDTYTIPGKPKPKTFEINGFISKNKGAYYKATAPTKLSEFKSFFDRARRERKPMKLVIANESTTIVNMECICTFQHGNVDSVGDVPYIIKVKEYKGII